MSELTPFALLRLPERFDLTVDVIENAWRQAIALVHPDRFAGRPAVERRVAEQWSGRINEAKDKLMDPAQRAMEILRIRGVDSGTQTDTRMDPQFLMQQMEWRERALEGGDTSALVKEIEDEKTRVEAHLKATLDDTFDAASAREAARRLLFIEKILRDLSRGTSEN